MPRPVMNRTLSPRRTRMIVGAVLAAAATALLAGCSAGSSVNGTYVQLFADGVVRSAWVIDGESAQYIDGSCDAENDSKPKVLSKDLTRITSTNGENYDLTWYEDRTGFVWKGHGDFINQDSTIGKGAVEKWEQKCGTTWEH